MNYQDGNISDDDDFFVSTPETNIIYDPVDIINMVVPDAGHMERIGVVNDEAAGGG